MGYIQDETWQLVKQVAKQNGFIGNWVYIIHSYYEFGGDHVQIHTTIDNVNYRILRLLDDKRVLLVNKENELTVLNFDVVKNSRKTFFYSEMEQKEITLPEGTSVNGKTKLKIYM